MAIVTVSYADMKSSAEEIERAATEIDNALQKIDGIVGDLETVWSDVNSKQYARRYEELKNSTYPEFKATAHGFSELITHILEAYRKEFIEKVKPTVN